MSNKEIRKKSVILNKCKGYEVISSVDLQKSE